MSSEWLPLTEYSSKYKVSISTLRRRIKSDEIKYQFDDGKYLILDAPVSTYQGVAKNHRSSLGTEEVQISSAPIGQSRPSQTQDSLVGAQLEKLSLSSGKADEPILTAANRLLTELKKAYTQILQEKEEQIFHLKEEIVDLKTLVRILEEKR